MGRSESLLSGGEEKTCREGGRKKKGGPFPSFSQALGDFLIDFQGYILNLFFRLGALWMRVQVDVFQAISPNLAQFGMFAWGLFDLLLPLASSFCSFFSPLTLLQRKKKRRRHLPKKACISRQDACADSIDPWLPLKHLLCLTDFSSFGLYMW